MAPSKGGQTAKVDFINIKNSLLITEVYPQNGA